MRTPKVSVFIPTFNRAHMLRKSISSVLGQTYDDFEIIISDNASEDATESVVRSFDDNRIRYIRNSRNIGLRGNWNRAFALTRGEYIAIFPDDDVMLPENLARKVGVLSGSSQIGLVHSKFDVINEDGHIVRCNEHFWGASGHTGDCLENRIEFLSLSRNVIHCSTVLFRSACYERLGKFTEKLDHFFDYEYWMRIALHYDIAFLATPLIKWRVHQDMATMRHFSNEYVKLREDMKAKQMITRHHLGGIAGGRELKEQIWKKMGQRFLTFLEDMRKSGSSEFCPKAIALAVCLRFPELLRVDIVRKGLLKSTLGSRVTGALKGLYLSFR